MKSTKEVGKERLVLKYGKKEMQYRKQKESQVWGKDTESDVRERVTERKESFRDAKGSGRSSREIPLTAWET